jgi:hypothetical protein
MADASLLPQPAPWRRCIIWAEAATGLALAVILIWLGVTTPWERVTASNCARVGKGMTEREVEAIFGRPADFEMPTTWPPAHEGVAAASSPAWHKDWRGTDCFAEVIFTEGSARKVAAVTCVYNPSSTPEGEIRQMTRRLARRLGIPFPF